MALFFGAQYGLAHIPEFHLQWLNTVIDWIASLLVVVGLFFLGAPVAALFASLFLDEIAAAVEMDSYPADPPSPGVSFWKGLFAGLRLAGWVILFSLILLPFNFLLPGIGTAADAGRQWLASGPRVLRTGGVAAHVAIGGAGFAPAPHIRCLVRRG